MDGTVPVYGSALMMQTVSSFSLAIGWFALTLYFLIYAWSVLAAVDLLSYSYTCCVTLKFPPLMLQSESNLLTI